MLRLVLVVLTKDYHQNWWWETSRVDPYKNWVRLLPTNESTVCQGGQCPTNMPTDEEAKRPTQAENKTNRRSWCVAEVEDLEMAVDAISVMVVVPLLCLDWIVRC